MRYLEIVLIENGSTTYLGKLRVNAELADTLLFLHSDKPKLLQKLLNAMLSPIKTYYKTIAKDRK